MYISYLYFSSTESQIMFPDIVPEKLEYIHLYFSFFFFYTYITVLDRLFYTLLIYLSCQFISENFLDY